MWLQLRIMRERKNDKAISNKIIRINKDSTFREVLITLVDDVGEYADFKVSVFNNCTFNIS